MNAEEVLEMIERLTENGEYDKEAAKQNCNSRFIWEHIKQGGSTGTYKQGGPVGRETLLKQRNPVERKKIPSQIYLS